MSSSFRLGSWIVDNWSRMSLPFAVLALCSLPVFSTAGNAPLILLYTLLPVYMIHQYEEHAHGRFVDFFNSTIGRGHEVLTKASAFWINILEVWVLFLVSFYLAKYVAVGIAFVPIYLTVFNGFTHVISSVALRKYNPGLYTSVLLFFPWGFFLLIYFNGIVGSSFLFNGVGLLAAIIAHAIIVVYAFRRRGKLEPG
ncbi:MAG: HXXEE domain-containing protein [Rubrobacter sp.]|nr:HXXEE domain-containing protein [Rubrobacter sp.]